MNTEKRLQKEFDRLVPQTGNAETVQGEVVRAIMRIWYRKWNDGDIFFIGYGCETAGPAATFLANHREIPMEYRKQFNVMIYKMAKNYSLEFKPRAEKDEIYDGWIESLAKVALEYVANTELTKSKVDMFSCGSDWEEEGPEDDDYPYGNM